jgi:hypothetical protein
MGLDMNLITTEAQGTQRRMRFLFFRKNAVFSVPLWFKHHERRWASGHAGRARLSRADEHRRGSHIAREFFRSWRPTDDSVAPYRSAALPLPEIPAPSPHAAERSSSEWDYRPIRNRLATGRVRVAAATGHSAIEVVREV